MLAQQFVVFSRMVVMILCCMLNMAIPVYAQQKVGQKVSIAAIIFGAAGSVGLGMYWRHLSRELEKVQNPLKRVEIIKELARVKWFMASAGLVTTAGIAGYLAGRKSSSSSVEPLEFSAAINSLSLKDSSTGDLPSAGTGASSVLPVQPQALPDASREKSSSSSIDPLESAAAIDGLPLEDSSMGDLPGASSVLPEQPQALITELFYTDYSFDVKQRSQLSAAELSGERDSNGRVLVHPILVQFRSIPFGGVNPRRKKEALKTSLMLGADKDHPFTGDSYITSALGDVYAAEACNQNLRANNKQFAVADGSKLLENKGLQDAFFAEICNGDELRVCVCDGTGVNALPIMFQNDDDANSSIDSGANLASAVCLALKAKRGDLNAATLAGIKNELELDFSPEEKYLFQYADNLYFGGGTTVDAITIKRHEGKLFCKFLNIGDGGAIVVTSDKKMLHGPSLNCNLEGFGCDSGKIHFSGDRNDHVVYQEKEIELPENASFLIVACDGFWDKFNGPRQVIDSSQKDAYINSLNCGKRPSANVGVLYSQNDIVLSWRQCTEIASRLGDTDEWLKKEYKDRNDKYSDESNITFDQLYEVVSYALSNGFDPAQALVALAARAGSTDDITVVVVDLKGKSASIDMA